MSEPEIREFLAHLAVDLEVSASTQTVALSALLFLYRDVLKQSLPYVSDIERAKTSKRLSVVFSRAEVQAVLAYLSGTNHLIASLLYGAGLRLMEAIRLRVKDIDFSAHQLTIREAKGMTDRVCKSVILCAPSGRGIVSKLIQGRRATRLPLAITCSHFAAGFKPVLAAKHVAYCEVLISCAPSGRGSFLNDPGAASR